MNNKNFDIIKAPVITEKALAAKDNNTYVFKVDSKAKKIEIKKAIEEVFKVKVEAISTANVKPKKRRIGRYAGLSNRYKKVYVRLAKDQHIDLGA